MDFCLRIKILYKKCRNNSYRKSQSISRKKPITNRQFRIRENKIFHFFEDKIQHKTRSNTFSGFPMISYWQETVISSHSFTTFLLCHYQNNQISNYQIMLIQLAPKKLKTEPKVLIWVMWDKSSKKSKKSLNLWFWARHLKTLEFYIYYSWMITGFAHRNPRTWTTLRCLPVRFGFQVVDSSFIELLILGKTFENYKILYILLLNEL